MSDNEVGLIWDEYWRKFGAIGDGRYWIMDVYEFMILQRDTTR